MASFLDDDAAGVSHSSGRRQHVVVMRHGDRMDNFDPLWEKTAPRPWDPPLIDAGLRRAFKTGRNFRTILGFPIHRVFVSPFYRCVQTAAQVVSALCAVDYNPATDTDTDTDTGRSVAVDPSRVKVSIEYGLCEVMNNIAIRPKVAPKDGKFSFNVRELEAMMLNGTVDHSVESVYKELPKWQETDAKKRYKQIVEELANRYPLENLLLVTHGEAVATMVDEFSEDNQKVYDVEYCAYTDLKRPIKHEDKSYSAGDFKVVFSSGIETLTDTA
ncbi:hypothetical protein K2173_011363 [Erythroxylum novogranatense]|uniref:Phosphoglycerate mutase family protein n=1 Tax=Erythroxylum novogranatense TaxID=1862640 RepID=A0AAV8S4D5_9ROSI|nr:hypothetical protein K2173_011363 [Erythroxylum novogranatense]